MRHRRRKPDIVTALRLKDGFYRVGSKVLSYHRAQKRCWGRGARWMRIIDQESRTFVDLVDLS